jgi:hypothetical protein
MRLSPAVRSRAAESDAAKRSGEDGAGGAPPEENLAMSACVLCRAGVTTPLSASCAGCAIAGSGDAARLRLTLTPETRCMCAELWWAPELRCMGGGL